MTARSRIALIQLNEKLQRNPEFAQELELGVLFEKARNNPQEHTMKGEKSRNGGEPDEHFS